MGLMKATVVPVRLFHASRYLAAWDRVPDQTKDWRYKSRLYRPKVESKPALTIYPKNNFNKVNKLDQANTGGSGVSEKKV